MSAPITKFVSVSTSLATKVVPAETFSTGLFLGCSESYNTFGTVPIDRRYLTVTRDDYADYLDSGTEEYNYATAYFSQNYTPTELRIGRVIRANSSPYTVLSGGSQDHTDYTSVTNGKLKFTDNSTPTPKVQEVAIPTLAGATSFAQVLTVINNALAALVGPTITDLNHCVFALDNLGRLCFFIHTVTGSTGLTIALTAASGATDLFSNTYLGGTQTVVPGYDAETLTDALQELQDLTTFYNVGTLTHGVPSCPSDSEFQELAEYIETQKLQLDILTNDSDTKDVLVTTDLASDIKSLSLDRTTIYYTERTNQRPEAANAGYVFPQKAGSCSFAYNPLSGVAESGYLRPLTYAEMAALDEKNVLYVCEVGGVNFVYKSLTTSAEEKRLILGIDWFDSTCQTDIINARLTSPIFTYDYNTFGVIEGILHKNAKEAAARNIIYSADDKDYPFVVTMPEPTSFSQAVKRSHVFTYECYSGTVKSEILNWVITGKFSI